MFYFSIQVLVPHLYFYLKTPLQEPVRLHRPPPQTPFFPPLLLLHKSPPALNFVMDLQMVLRQKVAARPPVQGCSRTLCKTAWETKMQQIRWRRLRRPKATKSTSTVRHVKWPSTPAPSWRLIAAVFTLSHFPFDYINSYFCTSVTFSPPVCLVASGSKHRQMLSGQRNCQSNRRFKMPLSPRPKCRIKHRPGSKGRAVVGVTKQGFHCELCQVSVNSETQLKQVPTSFYSVDFFEPKCPVHNVVLVGCAFRAVSQTPEKSCFLF